MTSGEKTFAGFLYLCLVGGLFIAGLATYKHWEYHNDLKKQGVVYVYKQASWQLVEIKNIKEQSQ